jgi:hypothetical protein
MMMMMMMMTWKKYHSTDRAPMGCNGSTLDAACGQGITVECECTSLETDSGVWKPPSNSQ